MNVLRSWRQPAQILALVVALPGGAVSQVTPAAESQLQAVRPSVRFAITPFVGAYGSATALVSDSMVQLRQTPALALGARFSRPLSPTAAVDASVAWSPSLLTETDWQSSIEHSGGVLLASVRAGLQPFRSRDEQWAFPFSAGVGLIHRHGAGWEGLSGRTDPALTMAAGFRMRTPGTSILWTIEAEAFASRSRFMEYTNTPRGTGLNWDLVLSLGAVFPIVGSER